MASVAPAPMTPASRPVTSTGQTPSAKRPATLASMALSGSSTAGPQLDPDALNQFLYALHYKVEAVEKWAVVVNDSITDHATHIDETRARATRSFSLVSDEINKLRSSAATGESDTRTVMKMVQDNDDALKASIASVVQMIGGAITTTCLLYTSPSPRDS